MTLRLCVTALFTAAGVISVFSRFPIFEAMVTGFLNTGSAAAVGCSCTCIICFSAFGAGFIDLVGMCCFKTTGIAVAATAGRGTAAGVIGAAEVEVTDFSFADHDAVTFTTGGAGVAFDCIEVVTFGVIDEAYVGKALFEK